jgi:hypothetical protein
MASRSSRLIGRGSFRRTFGTRGSAGIADDMPARVAERWTERSTLGTFPRVDGVSPSRTSSASSSARAVPLTASSGFRPKRGSSKVCQPLLVACSSRRLQRALQCVARKCRIAAPNVYDGLLTVLADNVGVASGTADPQAGVRYPVTLAYQNTWRSNWSRFYCGARSGPFREQLHRLSWGQPSHRVAFGATCCCLVSSGRAP